MGSRMSCIAAASDSDGRRLRHGQSEQPVDHVLAAMALSTTLFEAAYRSHAATALRPAARE
ncbi:MULTISPECIES: hypothetical protein [unclassified Burkholderia]|uniref:hypothetical protein n=1 Tax=unclassified Burkholderia TaxID=2613784 RepID=UPI0012E3EBC3|nr:MULTISPECIES: hypothetical protein [unclassified Burkholderia]